MSSLPAGWTEATLGRIVALKYGKGLPERSRKPGGVPVYGSNGIVGSHEDYLICGPAVIVGRKGSVGEVHLCQGPCWPIDTTYFVDELGEHSLEFWFWYLKHLRLGALDRATAIPGLNREDAYRLKVAVPPPSEQRRIVAKLHGLFRRSKCSREELTRIPRLIERYKQAILAAAFRGELTAEWRKINPRAAIKLRRGNPELLENIELPDSWASAPVGDICEAIVDCPHTTPKWAESGELCIRTTNFKPGKLDLSEVRYVSRETYRERIARLEPRSGDVLYSREGGILGIACEIPPNTRLCLGQRMMLMRTDAGVFSSSLLTYFLNSPPILVKVRELTGGSAAPHLNVGDIKKFVIPVPPRHEQDVLVQAIKRCFDAMDRLAKEQTRAEALLDRLDQATLEKAFRGELVAREGVRSARKST